MNRGVEEMWLCPECESHSVSCSLCDGLGFLTDMEFQHYEACKGRTKKPRKARCNNEHPLLTLDLSEFESET